MDKATKVAVEKYPHGTFDGEIGDSLRAACAVGYMQAKKDLALTWEDMVLLRTLFDATDAHQAMGALTVQPMTREYYEYLLCVFNEQRKK